MPKVNFSDHCRTQEWLWEPLPWKPWRQIWASHWQEPSWGGQQNSLGPTACTQGSFAFAPVPQVTVQVQLKIEVTNMMKRIWCLLFEISRQVEDSVCIAQALLSDLSGFKGFVRFSDDLLEVLRSFEQEQFEDWSRDILSGLANPKSGIRLVKCALLQFK